MTSNVHMYIASFCFVSALPCRTWHHHPLSQEKRAYDKDLKLGISAEICYRVEMRHTGFPCRPAAVRWMDKRKKQ